MTINNILHNDFMGNPFRDAMSLWGIQLSCNSDYQLIREEFLRIIVREIGQMAQQSNKTMLLIGRNTGVQAATRLHNGMPFAPIDPIDWALSNSIHRVS
jgi:hypothetical protein